MKIDGAKMNTAHNLLKDIAGPQGAFVLFVASGLEDTGEDFQIRAWGPLTRQAGVMALGVPFFEQSLDETTGKKMKQLPREPD